MAHADPAARRLVWTLVLLVSGCGPRDRFETVAGTVVFADGRPVAGGVVEFDPVDEGGRAARGGIGPDGRFTLKSGSTAGARPGRYRVAVVHVFAAGGQPHGHAHARVHPRFGRFETSGLEETVVAGGTNAPRLVVEHLPPQGR